MGLFDFLKKKELAEISELKKQLNEFQSIVDIEAETEKRKTELDLLITQKKAELDAVLFSKNNELNILNTEIVKLNSDYKQSLEIYTKLRKEVNLFESKLDVIEFGIYEPVYDFERSDQYRYEQAHIIDRQKAMIQTDTAAVCTTKWTVSDSEAKGLAVVNRYKKLMLRAFNGECEALISKVKWNNVNQMKERMQKLFDAINKLGDGFNVYIVSTYLDLKQKELILEYEYQSKRQQEKEDLRRAQEELREEEKAKKEFEQAQREAEKEEITFQKALEKARKEVEQATGERQDKLLTQIEKLEQELKEAHEKKERALSMAQQTRRGHVYVISNIGSFGENVYKIGMTRRLEPLDRIRELGDASVPFKFDIHALIYSEDAPKLENELHKIFNNRQVNMINYRKEFFKVSIDEVEKAINDNDVNAEFIRVPEAMEYRETMAMLEKLNNTVKVESIENQIKNEFPVTLILKN